MGIFSDEMKAGGASSFLKIEKDSKVLVVFKGAPLEYMNNYNRKEEYPKGRPLYPEGTNPAFKINVVQLEKGVWTPKIFQGTGKTAATIDSVLTKYGQNYLFEVERVGEKTTTRYPILPERALTPEEVTTIQNLPPIEMTLKTGV